MLEYCYCLYFLRSVFCNLYAVCVCHLKIVMLIKSLMSLMEALVLYGGKESAAQVLFVNRV